VSGSKELNRAERLNEQALTKKQREALELLREYNATKPGTAVETNEATWADKYNVWVHWRTARRLEKRGFVTLENYDPEWGYDVVLRTDES
jgi:hypothetical protein